jgi:hypothetical protein
MVLSMTLNCSLFFTSIQSMESFHLIINEHEQNAIINALTYYDIMHSFDDALDEDTKEQWKLCYKEDIASLGSPQGVDKLADRVATI